MIYVVIKVIFKIKKMYLNVMDFILCYLLRIKILVKEI